MLVQRKKEEEHGGGDTHGWVPTSNYKLNSNYFVGLRECLPPSMLIIPLSLVRFKWT
ncbi:hypothetical protein A2U01_0067785, partial [Trifolium medium]|nr:hypothetical protein [Trifolium medium]